MDNKLIVMLSDRFYKKYKEIFNEYDVIKVKNIDRLLEHKYDQRPVFVVDNEHIKEDSVKIYSKNLTTIVFCDDCTQNIKRRVDDDAFFILDSASSDYIVKTTLKRAMDYSNLKNKSPDSENYYKILFNSLAMAEPDAIFIRDRDGKYLDILVDKEREKKLIFGDITKMIGRNINEVLNKKLAQEFVDKINYVLDNNEKINYEYTIMVGGERRRVLAYIAPIKELDQVIWISKDITDEYNSKIYLQSIIDHRIDIINNINHEIRTPLNYISSVVSDVVIKKSGAFDTRLEKVKDSVDKIIDIIGKLMEFNNIRQDNLEVVNEDFDMFKIVETLSNKYVVKSYKKNLTYNTVIDKNIPRFYNGDQNILIKCIDILLDNAVKFTEKGEIYLKIGYSDGWLEVNVKDTGIGIEKEKIKNIFYEFIQEDLTAGKRYDGIGIGLTILTGLVKKVGGNIKVRSEKGKGTNFVLKYPVIEIKEREVQRESEIFRNKKAIIVDDDSVSRKIMELSLTNLGFQVNTFTDGWDVINYVSKYTESVDLLVVDWNIPRMDGTEISKKIRDLENSNHIKILLVTSFYDDNLSDRCNEVGINSFLYKPLDNSILYEKLHILFTEKGEEATNTKSYRYPGANVLIVDDSHLNLTLLENILKKMSIKVTSCEDGIEAVKNVKNFKYDFALIDIEMPIINGFETSKLIKKVDSKIPIVLMSAKEKALVVSQIKELNLDGFLGKPVDTNNLSDELSKHLGKYLTTSYEEEIIEAVELFDIPNVSMKNAMDRFHNNSELLLKSIKNFVLEYDEMKEIIIRHIIDEEYEELARSIHKLKGISGNLGIEKIYNWCVNSERNIENGSIDLIGFDELDIIHKEIKSFIERYSYENGEEKEEIGESEAKVLISDLTNSLKLRKVKDINECVDKIQKSSNVLLENFDEIYTSISKYNYKSALKQLMERD